MAERKGATSPNRSFPSDLISYTFLTCHSLQLPLRPLSDSELPSSILFL